MRLSGFSHLPSKCGCQGSSSTRSGRLRTLMRRRAPVQTQRQAAAVAGHRRGIRARAGARRGCVRAFALAPVWCHLAHKSPPVPGNIAASSQLVIEPELVSDCLLSDLTRLVDHPTCSNPDPACLTTPLFVPALVADPACSPTLPCLL